MTSALSVFRTLFMLLVLTAGAAQAVGEKAYFFDQDRPGMAPEGLVSSGDPWRVMADRQAVSAPHVLVPPRSALSGGQATLLLVKNGVMRDGDMGFRFRALHEGRPGMIGLVWRYRDAQNFYAVQLDLNTESVALIRRAKGKTKVLRSEGLLLTSPVWHALQVRVQGRHIAVVFNDNVVLQATDKTMDGPGQLGIQASPGDGVQIDDFAYRPIGEIPAK